MDEQFKKSILVLVEAANEACKKGAFTLAQAGQLNMAADVAIGTINKYEQEAAAKAAEQPEAKPEEKPKN